MRGNCLGLRKLPDIQEGFIQLRRRSERLSLDMTAEPRLNPFDSSTRPYDIGPHHHWPFFVHNTNRNLLFNRHFKQSISAIWTSNFVVLDQLQHRLRIFYQILVSIRLLFLALLLVLHHANMMNQTSIHRPVPKKNVDRLGDLLIRSSH